MHYVQACNKKFEKKRTRDLLLIILLIGKKVILKIALIIICIQEQFSNECR